ncbi:MAG: hypothetical protein ABI968_12225, partial [Acidobacteriota bacterium]
MRILERRPTLGDVRKAPLAEARGKLDDLYRLRPDRRFMAAVAATKRILRGGERASIQLSFNAGTWSIACDGQAVGNLPEFPSYADALTLLRAWATSLKPPGQAASDAAAPSTIDGEIDQFSRPHLAAALAAVDRGWNRSAPDARLAHSAGRALTLLMFQSFDSLELTNDIAGQALAALIIAETLGSERVDWEEALLGSMLGYSTEAREMGRRLGPRDPVRLYVEGNTAGLPALAEAHPKDAFLAYLAVRSLPVAGRLPQWESWVRSHFFSEENALPTFHAGLALDQFESNPSFAEGVIGTWMREFDPPASRQGDQTSLSGEPAPPVQRLMDQYLESLRQALQKKPAGLLRRFEEGLAKRPAPGPGPFWDAEADRAWTRASFYAAIFVLGRHYLDQLSTEEGAAAYASFLQDAPPGIGSDYVSWYQHLTAAKRGQGEMTLVRQDVLHGRLGFVAALRSYQAVKRSLVLERESIPEAISGLAIQLDSRPYVRVQLLAPLEEEAVDPIRVAKLCLHCRERSNSAAEAWSAAWCSVDLGDSRSLLRIASDPSQTVERRVAIVELVNYWEDIAPGQLRSTYRRLVEETGYGRVAVRPYVLWLDSVKDYGEQLRVVDGFLAHNPSDDLTHAIYIGRRAHCLSMLGRHAEAWKVIEPALGSGQGSVMSWGAEILSKLGRSDEALALARQSAQRYPDSAETRADLARYLWLASRDSEAALELGDRRFTGSQDPWQYPFARAFAETFGALPAERAVRAFQTLQEQKIPYWWLEYLPEKLGDEKHPEHAFRLFEILRGTGSYEYPWSKA